MGGRNICRTEELTDKKREVIVREREREREREKDSGVQMNKQVIK